jgi:hypothetical protein
METFDKIKHVIDQFNDNHNGQVNLASDSARGTLARMIHNALNVDSDRSETYNEQQLYLFSNFPEDLHK